MPTIRLAFDFLGDGSTLNGTTYYDIPSSLPAAGANGWRVLEVEEASTLGKIRSSTLAPFIGLGGYFVREISIFSEVEASVAVAIQPPQGGGVVQQGRMIEGLVTAIGFNGNLPGASPFQPRPFYVPPGWELALRCGDGAYGGGNLADFAGSIGFVFDSIRDFEEAAGGFLALDFNRPSRPQWT